MSIQEEEFIYSLIDRNITKLTIGSKILGGEQEEEAKGGG